MIGTGSLTSWFALCYSSQQANEGGVSSGEFRLLSLHQTWFLTCGLIVWVTHTRNACINPYQHAVFPYMDCNKHI